MISKSQLLEECLNIVHRRIDDIKAGLRDADEALANDTKSSAGDKYETSREMVQQDINRYQKQLALAENDQTILLNTNLVNKGKLVVPGTLVSTNLGLYFICISIGVLKMNDTTIYVISPASPLGQLLLGKKVADVVKFNGNEHTIISLE